MASISAVIITFNEANRIASTLDAIQGIASEIIVIDSHSTDDTVSIAEAKGAKVISRKWEGYARTKNFGNQQASHDWILSIDADEVISDELKQSIQSIKLASETVYYLDRITSYKGKWIKYCGWYPDWKPRLFNRNTVSWKGDFVHEVLSIPSGEKSVKLKGKLYHHSYPDKQSYEDKIRKYADLAAEELKKNGSRSNKLQASIIPTIKFIKTYFLKLGFLEGKEGLEISQFDALLQRLKFEKLEQLWQKK